MQSPTRTNHPLLVVSAVSSGKFEPLFTRRLIPGGLSLPQKKPSPAQNAKKPPKAKAVPTLAFLYVLREPDTRAVRYAGKANDPQARLTSHIRDARRRNAPLHCWIRSLGGQGKRPSMEVLGSVPIAHWEDAERTLIEILRRTTPNLLNLAAGGNEPKVPAGDYLAANGRRTARAIHHGSQRARRVWELRKLAGTEIAFLESRGDTARVAKLRSALARLDAKGATCR